MTYCHILYEIYIIYIKKKWLAVFKNSLTTKRLAIFNNRFQKRLAIRKAISSSKFSLLIYQIIENHLHVIHRFIQF
jgi:hypothetical protein